MERQTKKILLKIISLLVLVGFLVVGVLLFYSRQQMIKIPSLSFQEALEYMTKDNPDAVISVGFVKDGESSFTVYGENATELPKEQHVYEIASLTKTFTATLLKKAMDDGFVELDDTIDQFLPLPKENHYPTIEELLTHTAGYKGFYLERPMIANFLHGRNSFYGVNKEMVWDRLCTLDMDKSSYPFAYSNFTYAVLGLVLESIYDTDYTTLMNAFVTNELGLPNTKISDGKGDFKGYTAWAADDAYLSAGALTSTIDDMLKYAAFQMEDERCAACHHALEEITTAPQKYKAIGINMDAIGMSWVIDEENNFVWHNGGIGNFNSYLGMDLETKTAVVVLSNLPPSYRIPATILGIKLLEELR